MSLPDASPRPRPRRGLVALLAALLLLLITIALPADTEAYSRARDRERDREGDYPPDRGVKPDLHIVGLFHEDEWQEIMAFRAAAQRINMDNQILPNINLVPRVEVVSPLDSFAMSKLLCKLTAEGIGAVFGPRSKDTVNIVSSVTETLQIPHILLHYDRHRRPPGDHQVNVAPDPLSISKAIHALLVDDMGWKTFTIIYENDEGLVRLQEVLKAHGPKDSPITVRQLGDTSDYRPLLKEIHNSSESRIVLDASTDKIMEIFLQGREVKMVEEYISYVVTSLDAHTLDFSELEAWAYERKAITNITGIRLVDPHSFEVQNAVQDWIFNERLRGNTVTLDPSEVKVSAALIYDAVQMFARSVHMLNQTEPEIYEEPLVCNDIKKWEHGERIVSFMKAKYSNPDNNERGMTGPLSLNGDDNYRRTNFTLYLIDTLSNNATGVWANNTITLYRSTEEMELEQKNILMRKTMRVVSRIGAPYLMKKENWTEGMGSDGLEGYSIDLIDAIAKELKFKYEFYLVKDGKYGSLNPVTKQWDGLIKDLLDRKADLGICDLTITYDRERAVDFTMPFMDLGIAILFTRPQDPPQNLFSFLDPFSTEVWIYSATAFIGVSLLLFLLARTTPYEWDNPHPCDPDPEELENTFSLINSMWFAMGSFLQQGCDFLPKITPYEWNSPHPCDPDPEELENTLTLSNSLWHNIGSYMQQGSDIAPQAASTRMVAGMWWFFTLIMISSYTANLAAFLTSKAMAAEIKNAKDLANQNRIKYGCVDGGSTRSFFANSNFTDYQRMWATMDASRSLVFTKSNEEGVERVLKGKRTYAFLMESTSIQYEMEKHCELMMVGSHLDSKGYGIAMPRNSPYRTLISGAVLKLQEKGNLTALKQRWWIDNNPGGGKCNTEDSGESSDASKLSMANVGGVFLVLVVGCAIAFVFAIIEFLWNVRKVAIENKISPKEALMSELKFAVRCRGTTKPVKPKTPTPSSSPSSSRSFRSRSAGPGLSIGRSLMQLNTLQRLVSGGGDK